MKTTLSVKSLSLISARPIALFQASFGNSLSRAGMDHISSFVHMIFTRANPMRIAAKSDTARFFLRMMDNKDPLRTLIEKSVVHHHHWHTERILKEHSTEVKKRLSRQTPKTIPKVRDLLQEAAYHEAPTSKPGSKVEQDNEQSHTDTGIPGPVLYKTIIEHSKTSGTTKPKEHANRLIHETGANKTDETTGVSKHTEDSGHKLDKSAAIPIKKTTDRPDQKPLHHLNPKKAEATRTSEHTAIREKTTHKKNVYAKQVISDKVEQTEGKNYINTGVSMSALHQKIIEHGKTSYVAKPKEHANRLIHKLWEKSSNGTVTAGKQAKNSTNTPDKNTSKRMISRMKNRTSSLYSLNEVTTQHLYSSRHLERLAHNHSHKAYDKKVLIAPSNLPLKNDAMLLKKVQTQHAETALEDHQTFNKPVEITYKKVPSAGTENKALQADTVQNEAHDVSSGYSPHGIPFNSDVELVANHEAAHVMNTIEQGTLDIISRKVIAQVEAMWDREIMRRGGNHGI